MFALVAAIFVFIPGENHLYIHNCITGLFSVKEAVEAIRVGIAVAEQGKVKPARKALEELKEKLGISG